MATTNEPTLLAPISPVVFVLVLPSSRVHKLYIYNINLENRFSPDQWFVCFHAFPSLWASLLILSSNFNLFILQSFRSKVEYLHVCVCAWSQTFLLVDRDWAVLLSHCSAMKVDNVTKWYGQKLRERERAKKRRRPRLIWPCAMCYACVCLAKITNFPNKSLKNPICWAPAKEQIRESFFSYP